MTIWSSNRTQPFFAPSRLRHSHWGITELLWHFQSKVSMNFQSAWCDLNWDDDFVFSIKTEDSGKLATIFLYCPVIVGFSQYWDVIYGLPVLADPSGFGPFLMSLRVASLNSMRASIHLASRRKRNGRFHDIVFILNLNTPKLFIEMMRNLYFPLFLEKMRDFTETLGRIPM